MIVRTVEEIMGTPREVHAPNWVSRRLLLKQDGMGFSFHETTLYAGTETPMCYANHLEAVYCAAGEGEIYDEATNTVYPIRPGTMYALDQHDRHILRAHTELRMICVFNPPLSGAEVHDETGAYPLLEEAVEG